MRTGMATACAASSSMIGDLEASFSWRGFPQLEYGKQSIGDTDPCHEAGTGNGSAVKGREI